MKPNVQTFIGCDSSYEDARIALFGAPFDSTASFRPGARFAPQAMRAESAGIETFSPYLDRCIEDAAVFDAGDLELPFGNASRALDEIERFCARVLADGKTPVMIGGEHLATLGAVRAAAKKYRGLAVIHFDAHADMRDDYIGEKLSHATVIRRVWELVGDNSVFQFGIRSGCREEFEWGRKHVSTERFGAKSLRAATETLKDRPVYVTIDLDVLDSSEFPGTGTPEAGGFSFAELLESVGACAELNIIGFDLCELSPHYDASGISTAAACKTLRETLIAFGRRGDIQSQ
ncbi:MAG: agmatinase [Synergistaceae bacterium]|jgi:agmatinase|nr:agmatinase [Synergistaceae bacterium]